MIGRYRIFNWSMVSFSSREHECLAWNFPIVRWSLF
ncbi:hypothetical protein T01_3381 [Trichinella spiralis]|uniref:Uncharacterized protein n=1 Tax=Trichinella spiralis TaxID=6334 RepID=A0A0V0XP51_TRISP|nr:hypothetical protein T01_3381 [Trichinella spiralis]